MVPVTEFGTPSRTDELLARYPGLHSGVFANETDALLTALLLEERADRTGTNPTVGQDALEPDDVGSTYAHIRETFSPGEGWTQYQPGFVSSEIDIQATNPDNLGSSGTLYVGFTEDKPQGAAPGEPSDIVRYKQGDLPVAGIPANTGNLWVFLSEDAAGPVELYMEVWG